MLNIPPDGVGNWPKKKRKRNTRVMRYSDLEAREAYEQSLQPVSPKTIFIEPESPLEDDDDEILIAAVSKLLH